MEEAAARRGCLDFRNVLARGFKRSTFKVTNSNFKLIRHLKLQNLHIFLANESFFSVHITFPPLVKCAAMESEGSAGEFGGRREMLCRSEEKNLINDEGKHQALYGECRNLKSGLRKKPLLIFCAMVFRARFFPHLQTKHRISLCSRVAAVGGTSGEI